MEHKSNFAKKYSAIRLLYNQIRFLNKILYMKYGEIKDDFLNLQIDSLIFSKNCHLASVYKENLLQDCQEEFFKRFYKIEECKDRIPLMANYYKNYLKFFCVPFFRNFKSNKIIRNYCDRRAELYYKDNYGKKYKDENEQQNFQEDSSINQEDIRDIKVLFSTPVRDKIDECNLSEISTNFKNMKNSLNHCVKNKSQSDNSKGRYDSTCNLTESIKQGILISKRSKEDSFLNVIKILEGNQINKRKTKILKTSENRRIKENLGRKRDIHTKQTKKSGNIFNKETNLKDTIKECNKDEKLSHIINDNEKNFVYCVKNFMNFELIKSNNLDKLKRKNNNKCLVNYENNQISMIKFDKINLYDHSNKISNHFNIKNKPNNFHNKQNNPKNYMKNFETNITNKKSNSAIKSHSHSNWLRNSLNCNETKIKNFNTNKLKLKLNHSKSPPNKLFYNTKSAQTEQVITKLKEFKLNRPNKYMINTIILNSQGLFNSKNFNKIRKNQTVEASNQTNIIKNWNKFSINILKNSASRSKQNKTYSDDQNFGRNLKNSYNFSQTCRNFIKGDFTLNKLFTESHYNLTKNKHDSNIILVNEQKHSNELKKNIELLREKSEFKNLKNLNNFIKNSRNNYSIFKISSHHSSNLKFQVDDGKLQGNKVMSKSTDINGISKNKIEFHEKNNFNKDTLKNKQIIDENFKKKIRAKLENLLRNQKNPILIRKSAYIFNKKINKNNKDKFRFISPQKGSASIITSKLNSATNKISNYTIYKSLENLNKNYISNPNFKNLDIKEFYSSNKNLKKHLTQQINNQSNAVVIKTNHNNDIAPLKPINQKLLNHLKDKNEKAIKFIDM